ncbi:MAG TPA: hypothetical protein VK668_14475 [Mucilaginibacter sp.]|nr:hypothetical protein [Mucilaginibacter sp.]
MPIVYNPQTALQFTKVQLLGGWFRELGDVCIYWPESAKCEVLVVSQSPTGSEITYRFTNIPDAVYISHNANNIQLSAICVKSTVGDIAKCNP